MIITEYRVVLPMTVEEYKIGQLYSVAYASLNETGGGEGVQVLKNEPFENYPLLGDSYSSGQYTYKIYHLQKKAPPYIRMIAPKHSLELHEEAWNAFPYCKTVIKNPGYMKEKFYINIRSMHVQDRGHQDNVHSLDPQELKSRKIVTIDIANDPVMEKDYKEDADPKKFTSEKTKRGPLVGEWIKSVTPVMTCYKLVEVQFQWFGLQYQIEKRIQKYEQKLFTLFHRQLFCWLDKWHGMTMDDIRELEEEVKNQLEQQIRTSQIRGATENDSERASETASTSST